MKDTSSYGRRGTAILAVSEQRLESVLSINALYIAPDWRDLLVRTQEAWGQRDLRPVSVEPFPARGYTKHFEELTQQLAFQHRYEGAKPEFKLVSTHGLRSIDWWIKDTAHLSEAHDLDSLVQYHLAAKPSDYRVNARRTRHGFTIVSDTELEVLDFTLESTDKSLRIAAEIVPSPWWTEVTEYNNEYFVTAGQDRVLSCLRQGIDRIPVVLVKSDDIPDSREAWRLPSEVLCGSAGPTIGDFVAAELTTEVTMRSFMRVVRAVHEELNVPTALVDR